MEEKYLDAELVSAKLFKQEQKLVVEYELHKLLTASEIEKLRTHTRALMDDIKGIELELNIKPLDIVKKIQDDESECFSWLMNCATDIMPMVRPIFSTARCCLKENSAIEMSVPSRYTELLQKLNFPQSMKNFMLKNFGSFVEISIAPMNIDDEDAVMKKVAQLSEQDSTDVEYERMCANIALSKASVSVSCAAKKQGGANSSAAKSTAPIEVKIPENGVIMGKPLNVTPPAIKLIKKTEGELTVSGEIFKQEIKDTKNGGKIALFWLTDNTDSIQLKMFAPNGSAKNADIERIQLAVKEKRWLTVCGKYASDKYSGEPCLTPIWIKAVEHEQREDSAQEKRVELHLHTQMSAMDALVSVEDAVSTAARWGHKAVAITDHGVVQAFPHAVAQADKLMKKGKDIKVIMGVEGYLLPDSDLIDYEGDFCAVAFTSCAEGKQEAFFELAAVKFDSNGVKDNFYSLIDPGIMMPKNMLHETGIANEEFEHAQAFSDALPLFLNFIAGTKLILHDKDVLLALHNRAEAFSLDLVTKCVDTSMLYHYFNRDDKNISFMSACEKLSVSCENNRADGRARAQMELFLKLYEESMARGVMRLPLCDAVPKAKVKGQRSNFHIILIAKNHVGLVNLYRLVSYAHLEYLKGVPRIPRSLLNVHREGLIVGSACESGELFRAVLDGKTEAEQERIAAEYDYMEIQPIGNNEFLVRNGVVADDEGLRNLNRRILEIGDKLNKMTVATGDVHFLNPEDSLFRAVLMSARDFKDAEQQAPLYFKTTDEMLEEFSYLGEDRAYEIVVKNPNVIADMCEKQKPFLSEKSTYAPTFPGANDELRGMAEKRAHEIYGDELPSVVKARLEKELNSIIGNGYASLYLMAQRLVNKSMSDGYLVGSRGSVGSSFVATMAGITEVNPLQPHYVCKNCRHSDFDIDRKKYACGVDMPDMNCPVCGMPYTKLGYEIPFEVFLGFKGDKTPDIDLNFSGDYQSVAHKYTEVMFGEGHAFRAGTISGLKDKTVYGYIMKYCEANGVRFSRAETDRIIAGCCGVKRTTGQHPGGIVIVPEENDIMEFTPIQHPADKNDADTITTHFDFHALDDRLVKLDILGHDDPTVLRMLKDTTGLDPITIPLDDAETMKIYSSVDSLKVTLDELNCEVGTIAIPEFGTDFVRRMLMKTRPTTMEELLRISGLSHGTDVWNGNAEDIIDAGIATLSGVICTRDDIMNYLISLGGDPSISFKTMESVRKGRGLQPEMEEAMRNINTPEWFIDSCKKIKYLFPRAHAAAYVMMAFRVAFYKVHYPLAFYSVYYTVRADAFDIVQASGGKEKVLENIMALRDKGNEIETKEADLLTILEVVYEMNKRGIELLPIDLYKSDAKTFHIESKAIRPPFSSIAGVGGAAAVGLAEGRGTTPYLSIGDFKRRTKANSAVMSVLRSMKCFEGIPEEDQTCMF